MEVTIKNRVTHPGDFRDFNCHGNCRELLYNKSINIDTKLTF